jgi:hypothetical protein
VLAFYEAPALAQSTSHPSAHRHSLSTCQISQIAEEPNEETSIKISNRETHSVPWTYGLISNSMQRKNFYFLPFVILSSIFHFCKKNSVNVRTRFSFSSFRVFSSVIPSTAVPRKAEEDRNEWSESIPSTFLLTRCLLRCKRRPPEGCRALMNNLKYA